MNIRMVVKRMLIGGGENSLIFSAYKDLFFILSKKLD